MKKLLAMLLVFTVLMTTMLGAVVSGSEMSGDITAIPTSSPVLVDGVDVGFDAYNINDNNYFKLRDIAFIMDSTEARFGVQWDGKNKAINLVTGSHYDFVGGEMAVGTGMNKVGTLNTSDIYINGELVALTAYTIDGNNYFKLRDLGTALDFIVDWDGTNVIIKSSSDVEVAEEETPKKTTIGDFNYNVLSKEGVDETMFSNVLFSQSSTFDLYDRYCNMMTSEVETYLSADREYEMVEESDFADVVAEPLYLTFYRLNQQRDFLLSANGFFVVGGGKIYFDLNSDAGFVEIGGDIIEIRKYETVNGYIPYVCIFDEKTFFGRGDSLGLGYVAVMVNENGNIESVMGSMSIGQGYENLTIGR